MRGPSGKWFRQIAEEFKNLDLMARCTVLQPGAAFQQVHRVLR